MGVKPKKPWYRRLARWLRCPPRGDPLFGVHVREVIQFFFGKVCEWEHRADPGEEEHGKNWAKRHCVHCGRCQKAFFRRYDGVIEWEDQ